MCAKKNMLDRIFGNSGSLSHYVFGHCSTCGRHTVVNIVRTASGYGLIGGMIQEEYVTKDFALDFVVECDRCFQPFPFAS